MIVLFHTPQLFSAIFKPHKKCDCAAVFDHFSMSHTKASHTIADGIGPLVLKQINVKLQKTDTCFMLLFDETATVQNRKPMDVLVHFLSEDNQKIETRCIESFLLGRAPADTNVNYLEKMMLGNSKDIWNRLYNISSDGPAINKKIHRVLDSSLKNGGHKGLIPLKTAYSNHKI